MSGSLLRTNTLQPGKGKVGVCKERRNNQMEAMAAVGGNNKHWFSTAEMDDCVWRWWRWMMVFEGGCDGKERQQRATKTTARIELKWRRADGGWQTAVSTTLTGSTSTTRPGGAAGPCRPQRPCNQMILRCYTLAPSRCAPYCWENKGGCLLKRSCKNLCASSNSTTSC